MAVGRKECQRLCDDRCEALESFAYESNVESAETLLIFWFRKPMKCSLLSMKYFAEQYQFPIKKKSTKECFIKST